MPVYDISRDGRVGTRRFALGGATAFVGTGIFAAELVAPARERGLLLDAVVVRRSRVKNFLRRLRRDLREHRKPPLTLVRRGLRLMRAEPAVVARQMSLGCRPCDRAGTLARCARRPDARSACRSSPTPDRPPAGRTHELEQGDDRAGHVEAAGDQQHRAHRGGEPGRPEADQPGLGRAGAQQEAGHAITAASTSCNGPCGPAWLSAAIPNSASRAAVMKKFVLAA